MCLAIPGRVLDIRGDDLDRMGRVDFSGIVRDVSLAAVPEVRIGDFVIVHAGLALHILDESEAQATFDTLNELAASIERETEDARAGDPQPGQDRTP